MNCFCGLKKKYYYYYCRPRTPNSSYLNTTYSPNSTYSTHNTTNITHHTTHLTDSIHGPGSPGYAPNLSHTGQNVSHTGQNVSHTGQNTSHTQNVQNNGYSQQTLERKNEEKQYTVQSPTFSSFRPQEEPKQNYEGFTTR